MKENLKDMTEFGPVIDSEDGLEECFDNIEKLLMKIYSDNIKERKGAKFLVTKSYLDYKEDLPERKEKSVIKNLGFLLTYYGGWSCAPKEGFNYENLLLKYEEKAEAEKYKWDNYKPS